MKNYYDCFNIYPMFHVMVKIQHNIVIKCFLCDLDDILLDDILLIRFKN